MGSILEAEIDAHLRDGGVVITASDRAARALRSAFDRARRAEGMEAWITPAISSWHGFVRRLWDEGSTSSLLPLNTIQERSLWERAIVESGHPVSLLEGSRRRAAAMAMRAHALLCEYAPQYLEPRRRQSWDKDPFVFSGWLEAFDKLCSQSGAISSARLAHEIAIQLRGDSANRPPLLLAGFDRLTPVQSALLDAWGPWRHAAPPASAGMAEFYGASDPESEIAACARWCGLRLASNPASRILVIAQDVRSLRGPLERAFYREAETNPNVRFEFSLGVPLAQTGPARSALMLLRWLADDLPENEIDWLFFSGYSAASPQETASLLAAMRALRSRSLERPHWSLSTLLAQTAVQWPAPWTQRLQSARSRLSAVAGRSRSPIEWAEFVPQLLQAVGWPGASPRSSAEFQAIDAWRRCVESCGTLGFDGRKIAWNEFLSELRRACDDTVFAAESEDPPIVITGPAESAGITADAIWFLGADEDAWPARGDLNPLLPPDIQRSAAMPHASAQDDWNLADAVTRRLLASAPQICFSYSMQREGVELRPSRLIATVAASPLPVPSNLRAAAPAQPLTQLVPDPAAIPFPRSANDASAAVELKGGVALLTAQSQCPFKAFAVARLNAKGWEPAQQGLTPADRGVLLHAAMKSIWSGNAPGIRTANELRNLADVSSFVRNHVQRVMDRLVPVRARETMPPRYLELEADRLTSLIREWLAFEKGRIDFEVLNTENERLKSIAGISLTIRFDRLDRLNDGTVLVVDYKTGNVSPSAWDSGRPDDVQLPLYAGFGLDKETEPVGGLVFAKIRAGQMGIAGRVWDAQATIQPLKGNASLVKNPLTLEQLETWRTTIEKLAGDFLAGRSDVDPRDPATTCSRCDLQTLCRVHEYGREPDDDESEDDDE